MTVVLLLINDSNNYSVRKAYRNDFVGSFGSTSPVPSPRSTNPAVSTAPMATSTLSSTPRQQAFPR